MKITEKQVYAKIESVKQILFKSYRKKKISNTDFTIICNNCWGGYVYRRYDLPYLSPTIGLYFFADDFIKLCYDLKNYMQKKLIFINSKDSKWYSELRKKNNLHVPIARLGDIEVIFLHYSSEEEARIKWERRVKRINYDNLIFKFSKMNECTNKDLQKFDELLCNKKICFIPKNETFPMKSGIVFKSAQEDVINDDTSEYSRYIDLELLINSKYVCGRTLEGNYNE